MLIGSIVGAVAVLALTVTLLTRRMAHDDVHSVEGYHRSIHTLESINAHPLVSESTLSAKPRYPESPLRVAGTPSVRVTDTSAATVPPKRPPPLTQPDAPLTFDDAGPPGPPVSSEPLGYRDKAMGTMNHRPRRLAAPATAVAVVIVLVVVLLVTGSHTVAPPPRHKVGSSGKNSHSPAGPHTGRETTATTTSTTSPQVVVPQSGTARSATYDVLGSNFTLAFSATSGSCWVDVTNSTSGVTLFSGTLQPGAQRSLDASGPVTVILGAPSVLAVSLNGSPVALPSGFRTPFTMEFVAAN